jgi:hypothetical protein
MSVIDIHAGPEGLRPDRADARRGRKAPPAFGFLVAGVISLGLWGLIFAGLGLLL